MISLHLFSDLVNLHICFYLFLSLLMLDWRLLDEFIAYCFFYIYIYDVCELFVTYFLSLFIQVWRWVEVLLIFLLLWWLAAVVVFILLQ
jgi:hypothetical protein